MTALTEETDRATMDTALHLRILASPETDASAYDKSASLLKIVTPMQFQDITRQELEYVGQALDQWSRHLLALMKGPENDIGKQEMADMELIRQHHIIEEEDRLHVTAVGRDYGEPVPMDMSSKELDLVTLC